MGGRIVRRGLIQPGGPRVRSDRSFPLSEGLLSLVSKRHHAKEESRVLLATRSDGSEPSTTYNKLAVRRVTSRSPTGIEESCSPVRTHCSVSATQQGRSGQV